MLTQLTIQNYTVADHLEMEFTSGMTAITGETGAGKSIMLDALNLALGARGDSKVIRKGESQATIAAVFDIESIPAAQQWLQQRALLTNDELNNGECILRRSIHTNGRSKAWINGHPATMQDLKSIGEMLANIHGQHEHQRLLQRQSHQALLDNWGGLQSLASEVKQIAEQWKNTHSDLIALESQSDAQRAHRQLLQYQAEEFTQLELETDEIETLEKEQKQLSNSEELLTLSTKISSLCGFDDHPNESNISDSIQQAIKLSEEGSQLSPSLKSTLQLLTEASIQIQEAQQELSGAMNDFEHNPERLSQIENRLNTIYQVARKHQVQPEQLLNKQQSIFSELEKLENASGDSEALKQQLGTLERTYQKQANKLSKARKKAAKSLEKTITGHLTHLGMEHATLAIALHQHESSLPKASGNESVEFLISTNPGQTPDAISKIASGGELSRISLAIQVAIAETTTTPTLVFDEVDSGIGGATADTVGQLLRTLGESGQVICVTHLAQVAAKSHQHLTVDKQVTGKSTATTLKQLQSDEKTAEIARMLGGIAITQTTLAHANEMLGAVH